MIIIVNRLTKLLGFLVKLLGYIFHFSFPNKRFTIPNKSAAVLKSNRKSNMPKTLWQTNFTNKVTFPIYVNYLFNRLMSLSYEYRYTSNEECYGIIKKYGSKVELDAFSKIKDGTAQADFWRIFALNKFGGIYLDLDAQLVWPLSKIVKDAEELYVVPRRGKYTNYFIASKINNPILEETMINIINNINNIDHLIEEGKSVYGITGPSTLEKAIGDQKVNCRIYKLICAQGSFTNEYFQYMDKKNGKWIHTASDDILK